MSHIAIQVENLSKRYRIGTQETKHDTLLAAAVSWLKSPLNNFRRLRRLTAFSANGDESDVLYALKDISFTVNQGEVVGIIGRNGAGKSTLLKILSRITPPSDGRIILNGRVASLLEVGTGFHPELTGRENVYLNGTVLGMTKTEVARKFDEIVAFSGVEKFIDTPVKWYSSGMRVRLAFSVAAHLEPEILLVDEVLAVGDAEFQQKCLGKMENVAESGRTVLFVSHNMQAIQRLCRTVYLLNQGQLIASGDPLQVINTYLEKSSLDPAELDSFTADEICLNRVVLLQAEQEIGEYADQGKPITIQFEYELPQPVHDLLLGFDLTTADGTHIFRTYDLQEYGLGTRKTGQYVSICQLPAGFLPSGYYYLDILLGIHRRKWLSRGQFRIRFHVSGVASYDVDFPGMLLPLTEWQVTTNLSHASIID